MKIACFSVKPYDREFLLGANSAFGHELTFLEPHLSHETVALADGFPAVCVFVNDRLDRPVLEGLASGDCTEPTTACARAISRWTGSWGSTSTARWPASLAPAE